MNKRYGWRPDTPDARDFRRAGPNRWDLKRLPADVDLRPLCPPVKDQGPLGACTGFACAGLYEFIVKGRGGKFDPSELFLYYNERVDQGTVDYDSGAEIRTGMKSLARNGICLESTWPYKVNKFKALPSVKAYEQAQLHQSLVYSRVGRTLPAMRAVLAAGLPFAFGFSVYSSFESATVERTGTVPMPKPTEKMLGGHAVICVGYSNAKKRFRCRNSWGAPWGDDGYFTMPYAYLLDENLSDDFWVLTEAE